MGFWLQFVPKAPNQETLRRLCEDCGVAVEAKGKRTNANMVFLGQSGGMAFPFLSVLCLFLVVFGVVDCFGPEDPGLLW